MGTLTYEQAYNEVIAELNTVLEGVDEQMEKGNVLTSMLARREGYKNVIFSMLAKKKAIEDESKRRAMVTSKANAGLRAYLSEWWG